MGTFDISSEVGTVGLSMYILGFAVGPLMLAPMSEYFGRNPVYVLSWLLLVIFQVPLALAPNVATVIACRLLQGFFGSAPLTVGCSRLPNMRVSRHSDSAADNSLCRTQAAPSATFGREMNAAQRWLSTASPAPAAHRLPW